MISNRRICFFLALVIVETIIVATAVLAQEARKPDNLTVRELLAINAALSNMNCQGGYILRDGGKETVTCKVFDFVTDKNKIALSRAIADDIAATESVGATYRKLRNQFIAALTPADRDKDGNLTQAAAAKLALWDDEYLAGGAGSSIDHLTRFKRSELEAVGFQPSILAALRPITDVDN